MSDTAFGLPRMPRAFSIGQQPAEGRSELTQDAGLRCGRLRPADGYAIEAKRFADA